MGNKRLLAANKARAALFGIRAESPCPSGDGNNLGRMIGKHGVTGAVKRGDRRATR